MSSPTNADVELFRKNQDTPGLTRVRGAGDPLRSGTVDIPTSLRLQARTLRHSDTMREMPINRMDADTGGHRDPLPGSSLPDDERIALIVFHGALFFGAAGWMVDQVTRISGVDVAILRLSPMPVIQ